METAEDQNRTSRRKRVARLKKIILGTIVMAVCIPLVTSLVLGIRLFQVSRELEELKVAAGITDTMDGIQPAESQVTGSFVTSAVEESARDELEPVSMEQGQNQSNQTDRKIYLTFDDGPSNNTAEILDILKEYDVKATFFVVGREDEQSKEMYRRIVSEGHTLGMHSYSHKYSEIYQSMESFTSDLTSLQEYLYETTGIWSRYYRFPGGSSNTVSQVDMNELMKYLDDSGIMYYDWNIASGDAISGQIGTQDIVDNCMEKIQGMQECMILMHDASQKNTTVEALPIVIESIKNMEDTELLPITDETVPVQHRKASEATNEEIK